MNQAEKTIAPIYKGAIAVQLRAAGNSERAIHNILEFYLGDK